MTEIDEISARLTVLETVVSHLITHMAIRDDDPSRWVRTRKTLAMRAIDGTMPVQARRLHEATAAFFDQAEEIVAEYGDTERPGTPPVLVR